MLRQVRAPRLTLLRLAGCQSRLELSLKRRRWGYLLTSRLPLSVLRARLMGRYAYRILEVHAPSGRYFLEPSVDFLIRGVLGALQGPQSSALAPFFTPPRRDRLRRVSTCARVRVDRQGRCQQVGSLEVRRFLLRLESLPWSRRPERLVEGLGRDFDELWRRGRLLGPRLDLSSGALAAGLCRLQDLGDEIASLGEKRDRELKR